MTGCRLSDQEFLTVLAVPEPWPRWDLDDGGRFLVLPLAERDLAWMLECCCEDTEGNYHVLRDGDAVLFACKSDLAFARFLTL